MDPGISLLKLINICMVNKYLIDSDFIIACIHSNESNHKAALKKFSLLSDSFLYVSHYVPIEVTTVLSHNYSQKFAIEFLKGISHSFIILDSCTPDLVQDTHEFFYKQTRKNISWIDCHNAVCMNHFKMNAILSFDSFYRKIAIPVF